MFLPCRLGSQRVKRKNVRTFAGIKGGLTYIKLAQLLRVPLIDQIILSTNDQEVKEIAYQFNSDKIIIDDRPENLASSSTSTDELIEYVGQLIQNGNILWTHVTSPFLNEDDYSSIINDYWDNLEKGFDSLMTVTPLYKFLWFKKKPVNYIREKEKWPRTQTLEPIYEVNSGAFMAPAGIYKTIQDRIGKNPFFYELDEMKSYDIDWVLNFNIAEQIWKNEKEN